MAFNNTIRRLTTADTTHADNFNDPLQKLLENDLYMNGQITVLSSHFYWDFAEIGSGITQDTPLVTLVNSMRVNSRLSALVNTTTTNVYPATTGQIVIEKINQYRNYITFIVNDGKVYSNYVDNGYVFGWKQLATTEKVTFSVTPNTGYTIVKQSNYIINGLLYVNTSVKKMDNTQFIKDVQVAIINLTSPPSNTNLTFTQWSIGGNMIGSGGVGTAHSSNLIYVSPSIASDIIQICGVVLL